MFVGFLLGFYRTMRTGQCACLVILSEVLPSRNRFMFPSPLLPTMIRSWLFFSAVVSMVSGMFPFSISVFAFIPLFCRFFWCWVRSFLAFVSICWVIVCVSWISAVGMLVSAPPVGMIIVGGSITWISVIWALYFWAMSAAYFAAFSLCCDPSSATSMFFMSFSSLLKFVHFPGGLD